MIPEEPCTRATIRAFEFENCTIGSMQHVKSSALDASNADRAVSVKFGLGQATLFHNQLLVLDLDILPIVFGIEDGGWIIGHLLVIEDHPILVEMSSQRVIEHFIDIEGVVAKVLVQMMSVDSIMVI